MGWWTSVGNTVSSALGTAGKWVWNNTPLKPVVTFTANTVFHTIEQVSALRTAVPAWFNNKGVQRIAAGMGHIIWEDLLPVLFFNFVNNRIQAPFQPQPGAQPQEEQPWYAPYSLFLYNLMLLNYLVMLYTWRQGGQAITRVLILNTNATPVFNAHKEIKPPSLCDNEECTQERFNKGEGRGLLVLLANDALTGALGLIPVVGTHLSRASRIIFTGRFETGLITPERCERHKQIVSEFALSLGLTHEALLMLMDEVLERFIGMPPAMQYYVMKKLLLLVHVNVAAHMVVPQLPPETPIYMDPANLYERVNRFWADVFIAGLKVRVPIDFKLEEGAEPVIPLTTALQFCTNVLNSDLPVEGIVPKPGYIRRAVNALRPWVMPPMLRNWDNFSNDPIIADNWKAIRGGVISIINILNSIGRENNFKSKLAKTARYVAPVQTEKLVQYQWKVPRIVTREGIKLSYIEEFWALAAALKGWFERHNVHFEVQMADGEVIAPLLGQKKIEPVPEAKDVVPTVAATKLVSQRPSLQPTVIDAEDLVSSRRVVSMTLLPGASADSLFTTRKRAGKQGTVLDIGASQSNAI